MADIIVSGCSFEDNYATNAGGGICASQQAAVRIGGCTFYQNRAYYGGGLAVWDSRYDVDNTIIAFSEEGNAISFYGENQVTLRCSDLYGNAGGDWTGEIEDQLGVDGNICMDPIFCLEAHPEAPLSLHSESPCAADQNPACGLIGAWPVGCGDVSTVDRSFGKEPLARMQLQAFPNPFAGTTTIHYYVAAPMAREAMTLGIHDLLGRRVRTLAMSPSATDRQVTTWDGSDENGDPLPGGVYLLGPADRKAGETQRMLLVR